MSTAALARSSRPVQASLASISSEWCCRVDISSTVPTRIETVPSCSWSVSGVPSGVVARSRSRVGFMIDSVTSRQAAGEPARSAPPGRGSIAVSPRARITSSPARGRLLPTALEEPEGAGHEGQHRPQAGRIDLGDG